MQKITKAFCLLTFILLFSPAFAKPAGSGGHASTHSGIDTPVHEEQEALVNPKDATGTDPNDHTPGWYWFVLLPLAGIAVGYGVAKATGSKVIPGNPTVKEKESVALKTLEARIDSDETKPLPKQNYDQLKQKYEKLREDHKILKQNVTTLKNQSQDLQKLIDSDAAYFKTAFQEMVLPLQTAIDKGDVATVFKYLTLAALQYSAITRVKLSKRQNYDSTNINTLMKAASDHENYPEINQATPVDKTPANLRELVAALKQLGVKDLDNYILQGYKLKER